MTPEQISDAAGKCGYRAAFCSNPDGGLCAIITPWSWECSAEYTLLLTLGLHADAPLNNPGNRKTFKIGHNGSAIEINIYPLVL